MYGIIDSIDSIFYAVHTAIYYLKIETKTLVNTT
jgi:hypothetical protein